MPSPTFLTFEPLTQRHLNACTEIAATAPDPWSAKDVAAELKSRGKADFVAISKDGVVGFAFFSLEPDCANLNQIVVSPEHKRQGIGKGLLTHAIQKFKEQETPRIILEVRQGNTAAISLYKSLGFEEIACRPALYANPPEDGFTMEKILL